MTGKRIFAERRRNQTVQSPVAFSLSYALYLHPRQTPITLAVNFVCTFRGVGRFIFIPNPGRDEK